MAALAAMGGAGISDLLGAGAAGAGADALGSAIVEGGGSDVLGGLAEFGGFPSLEASEAAAFPNAIGVNAGLDAAAASVAAPTAATLAEFGGFPSLEASEAAAFPNAIGANAGLDAATAAGTASHLTPAAIESLSGTPGYGTNASALQYALDNGLPTNLVGAGALAGGLNFADLTKGASTINSLLNSFKQGATLGSLDGSNSSGSSSGSRLGSDLARVGQMGSGNSLLHAVQGLYSGSPTGFAEGGSTNSGLDNYNPLKGDTVKVGDVGKNITLSRELASLYGDNALAHGGQPHVDPRLMALIRARANTADKQHPNYDGTPVFRTGGLEGLGGKYVEGNGDGQSDDIPAMLADGEYVFDAQTVADFGNGSNKAGAKMLDAMREAIRAHKRNSPLDSIPPKSKTPEQYLMDARKYLKGVK